MEYCNLDATKKLLSFHIILNFPSRFIPAKTRCFGRQRLADRHYILRGSHGSVGAGMLVGILGESGSGKTTLLRALAKQLEPSLTAMGTECECIFYIY